MLEASKLGEAEYFLSEMARVYENHRLFQYNLSAFLSATRSVLQYACREATSRPGGQVWYEKQVTDHAVISFFRKERDTNIHHEPVKPAAHLTLDPADLRVIGQPLQIGDGKHWDVTPPPEPPTVDQGSPAPVPTRYRLKNWTGGEDVPALCRRYLDDLKAVVADGQTQGFLTP